MRLNPTTVLFHTHVITADKPAQLALTDHVEVLEVVMLRGQQHRLKDVHQHLEIVAPLAEVAYQRADCLVQVACGLAGGLAIAGTRAGNTRLLGGICFTRSAIADVVIQAQLCEQVLHSIVNSA
jgi:hypothetical protein